MLHNVKVIVLLRTYLYTYNSLMQFFMCKHCNTFKQNCCICNHSNAMQLWVKLTVKQELGFSFYFYFYFIYQCLPQTSFPPTSFIPIISTLKISTYLIYICILYRQSIKKSKIATRLAAIFFFTLYIHHAKSFFLAI